jgi:hypothetical protein
MLRLALDALGVGQRGSSPEGVALGLCFLALLLGIIYGARAGRNSSRIFIALYTVLLAFNFLGKYGLSPQSALQVAHGIAALAALPLATLALFLPRSNAWFRAVRARAAA